MTPGTMSSLRMAVLLVVVGIGVAALWAPSWLHLSARIVYNASASVAPGWYRVDLVSSADSVQGPWQVGSIVLAQLPADVVAFAAQRGYLPTGVPILKRVGAIAPQAVCVRNGIVHIDGTAVATVLMHDGAHRPLHPWTPCRPLAEGELFLLSDTHPASFDSRYFGPIAASSVLGVARPLWTWGAP